MPFPNKSHTWLHTKHMWWGSTYPMVLQASANVVLKLEYFVPYLSFFSIFSFLSVPFLTFLVSLPCYILCLFMENFSAHLKYFFTGIWHLLCAYFAHSNVSYSYVNDKQKVIEAERCTAVNRTPQKRQIRWYKYPSIDKVKVVVSVYRCAG